MDVINDEDFDRLWDEAVAEAAAVKSTKSKRSKSLKVNKHNGAAVPSAQSSGRRRSNTIAVARQSAHQPCQRSVEENVDLRRVPSTASMPSCELSKDSRRRRPSTESNGEFRRLSSESSGDGVSRNRRSFRRVPSTPSIQFPNELTTGNRRRHSSTESSSQSRRPSTESSGDGLSRRQSSVSMVPSIPSFNELSKHSMFGRESKTNPMAMDESVTSFASGFSGFESVSVQEQQPQRSTSNDSRRKQVNNIRPKSRSPTPGVNKQKSIEIAQQGAANYVLTAESSELQRLQFEIPATYEVRGHKENRNQSTGLVLTFGRENDAGTVIVKGISPTSLFASTRLKSGDEILMINSHRVKSPQQAAKIMKSLSGDVTIYASEGTRAPGMKYIRVKANRSRKSAEKDLTLVTNNNGLVRVAYVDPHGTYNKALSVGDIVITVNGTLIQDEEEAEKRLLETVGNGVNCVLIYSMADLCKGLINQLLPDWKNCWLSAVEFSLSRDDVSFVVTWRDDWVCECSPSDDAASNSDIKAALGEMNWAMSSVINGIVEASGIRFLQISANCNTCIAAIDPTSEERFDDESCQVERELKESQQITAPTIAEDFDASDESEKKAEITRRVIHERIEISQEPSNSQRPSLLPGKSLFLELNADDDSSVEDC